jgi:histidyl-tRNA synthetase
MTVPSAPGVFDILPVDSADQWRSSYIWQYVESVLRETAKNFGYKEIRTPIFERTELFIRGVGDTSDIVTKEMYTFVDKGDRSLTLRPEGTAPVIRAFVEHKMHTQSPIQKLFYIAPMFRYERAQAGRYRQHHQFGAEAIGIASPEQDVELIDLVYTVYTKLGLNNLQVYINSIGTPATREAFKEALKEYLNTYLNDLSEDSKRRFSTNPLRILDSKDPKDQEIVKNAPSILDFLDEEGRTHFEAVKRLLDLLKIPYKVNPLLVRGLDYYNKTVFEITAGELGAQNSVGGGGRYDGLLKSLGGPDLPTIGFGTGIERIILTMLKQQVSIPEAPAPELFIIPLGDMAKEASISLIHDLRQAEIPCEMDLTGKKLGKVMQYANLIKAKYVLVLGEDELKSQIGQLKDMQSGKTLEVPLNNLQKILRLDLKNEDFMKMLQEISEPLTNQSEIDFYNQKLEQKLLATKNMLSQVNESMDKMKQNTSE